MEINKLIENMELKLLKTKKDLRNANEKIDFLISDVNKLKRDFRGSSNRGLKGGGK